MQAQLIYALPAGWQVRVISRQPGWVQVQDANSGAAGWVEATALAPSGGQAVQVGGRIRRLWAPRVTPTIGTPKKDIHTTPPWRSRWCVRRFFAPDIRRLVGLAI